MSVNVQKASESISFTISNLRQRTATDNSGAMCVGREIHTQDIQLQRSTNTMHHSQ